LKNDFRITYPEYYRGVFLEIQKFMEVREEDMEVQKETVKVERGGRPIFTWAKHD